MLSVLLSMGQMTPINHIILEFSNVHHNLFARNDTLARSLFQNDSLKIHSTSCNMYILVAYIKKHSVDENNYSLWKRIRGKANDSDN